MVSVGLKALPSRKHKLCDISEDSWIADRDRSSFGKVIKTRKMGRKGSKTKSGFQGGAPSQHQPGAKTKARNFGNEKTTSASQASFIRKQVDPEMTKYFTEIANLLEGNEIDSDERSAVCGTALEEAKGKEVELATDYIISHTMQALLEECSAEHLCGFLRSCADKFSYISADRSGSHVAETALKSLAKHLEDDENHSLIEETLSVLCQEIVSNPMDVACNCYGSHVLRRLLCLCKGVPMESSEFHSANPSMVLAERLNLRSHKVDHPKKLHYQPFLDQLKLLVSEMLNPLKVDVEHLLFNQYSSLVLQTALKLLAGQEEELLRFIPVLLGFNTENGLEQNFAEVGASKKIIRLVEENAYSHLMEVILAVAPDTIYDQILTKLFKDSLFRMSSHASANFVVQALVSHARNQGHIKLIFGELGSKITSLLEQGRSGVVAALLVSTKRLQIFDKECCAALVNAVCSTNESSAVIIPRILFLDNYFFANDKANWNWPDGSKMSILGSLILQSVFKFPSEFIQAFITSITSLEDNHVLEALKDPAGARVIEAFLSSNASAKQKRRLINRLKGHFGDLSLLQSASFTIEKCFTASNLSLRETIVSELLPVQADLSKTKQGPFLLKKLDVEGFSRRPDQWRSRQTSKESTYREFYESFGSNNAKSSSRSANFLSGTDTRHKSNTENLKEMRKEIDTRISSGVPFLAHHGHNSKKRKSNADGFLSKSSNKKFKSGKSK